MSCLEPVGVTQAGGSALYETTSWGQLEGEFTCERIDFDTSKLVELFEAIHAGTYIDWALPVSTDVYERCMLGSRPDMTARAVETGRRT